MSYTPRVAVLHEGLPVLDELDVEGIPVGSLLRTADGHYYRLAESDDEVTAAPAAPDDDAVAGPVAASATNLFAIRAQPDYPRNVTVTVSAAALAWDGGPITIRGTDSDDEIVSEEIQPLGAPAGASLSTPGKVSGSQLFKRITGVSKRDAGSSTARVTVGFGENVEFSPDVVAVRGHGSMRWLLADDEVLETALPKLYTWDTNATGNYGRPVQGQCTTLQDVVDANNFLLRAVVSALHEAGIATGDVLDGFLTTSER